MKKTYLLSLFLLFSSILTNVYSQSPTCAGANPFCAGGSTFTFPNTTGSASIGSPGCLGSAPNPAWFYIQVSQSGNIDFLLTQGNNAPIYNNQDVDFIAWGPFASPSCVGLYDFPDGNTSVPNNIVACSYSGSPIEAFTIPNTVVGQYYMILITNFSNQSGQITMTQTNDPNLPGVGEADCSILCPLSLGPDVEVCPGTTTILTASIDAASSYVWTSTAAGFVDPGNVQSITVSVPGTYTVVVNKPGCVANSTSSATITVPTTPATGTPNDLIRCITNPIFDLTVNTPVVLNGLSGYTISYHNTLLAAQDGTSGLTIPNTTNYVGTNGETIYMSIEDNNTACILTTSFQLILIPQPTPPNPADVTACDSYVLPALGANETYHSASGGLPITEIPAGTVITTSQTIYIYAQSAPGCGSEGDFVVTIITGTPPNPSDVTVCGSYTLPALPSGSTYHSASGGASGTLNSGWHSTYHFTSSLCIFTICNYAIM